MMPDLGKYGTVVLSAYGAAIVLIAALILFSWLKGRRVYRALRQVEERRAANKSTRQGTAQDG